MNCIYDADSWQAGPTPGKFSLSRDRGGEGEGRREAERVVECGERKAP